MARLVGINHVALEVGDLDEALAWYGRLFEFDLRGRIGQRMAFIDMGDQFLALRPNGGSRAATIGTSGSWSTTRRRCGRRSRAPAPRSS